MRRCDICLEEVPSGEPLQLIRDTFRTEDVSETCKDCMVILEDANRHFDQYFSDIGKKLKKKWFPNLIQRMKIRFRS